MTVFVNSLQVLNFLSSLLLFSAAAAEVKDKKRSPNRLIVDESTNVHSDSYFGENT